ncbi:putative COX1 assembly protein Shy1, partial [Coniella lustricola]
EPRQPADDPTFHSILDNPTQLVRAGGRRHGPGLIILALIPITAFALGSWQVQRLQWKTDLIAKCEDRLVRPPLPLPPRLDTDAISDGSFDYRRVVARGTFRHDQEMLIGPRMRDGEQGYMVITPLERGDDGGSTVLVNRGWISKAMGEQRMRQRATAKARRSTDKGEVSGQNYAHVDALPQGQVVVEGLLRAPWKKNMFTPENRPDKGEFYFPDVRQMAELTGAQPVWIEATMDPNYMQVMEYEARGVPLGRPAEVNLRNNHAQYIFTWYSLSLATAIMLWMVVKKPPSDIAKRVRKNTQW